MYESFYNFLEKPFSVTPDTRFFYSSAKHLEALNNMIYAIDERKGFVVITGEIGAGKTTVCRTLINKIDVRTKVALITNTNITPRELLSGILEEFEIENKGGTKQKLLSRLNEFLINQLSQDNNVVLIIDEAQNLTPKVLEEIRMLSNLETEREKLIQIILLGQPQLKAKLQSAKLQQFKQRIALYYHLSGLSDWETFEYIRHRLKLASFSNEVAEIFEPAALSMIYAHSRGIPRIVNLVCDSALLSGYIFNTKKITEKIIRAVIKERDLNNNFREEDYVKEIIDVSNPDDRALEMKIYCCPDCPEYVTCEIKWAREILKERQICCNNCKSYKQCINNISKIRLN